MRERSCEPPLDERWAVVWPSLQSAASRGALVIFGGERRRPKLARLQRCTRLPLEWVEVRDANRLAWRVRRGEVAAVVLLDGLVSHAATDELVQTMRRRRVLHAYGGRGGIRRVLDALVMLGGRLAGEDGEL